MEASHNQKTYVLVAGWGHGEWCWQVVTERLRALGHKTISPQLSITDPSINMDGHANYIEAGLPITGKSILVGHSRSSDIISRVATTSPEKVGKLIHIAGGIRRATDQAVVDVVEPKKYLPGYIESIIKRDDGLSYIKPVEAKQLLYHDCTNSLAEDSLAKLRPQNRNDDSPALATQPAVPSAYIICEQDRIINPEWQRFAATVLLENAEITSIDSGHSPFLSKPYELVETLVKLA